MPKVDNGCKDNKIAIYIPCYNGANFLKTVFIPSNCDCIVMDNCSTDNTFEICKERGFICVNNNENVVRTKNWLRCLEHFKDSKYEWMKWLFVGDELDKSAGIKMENAISRYGNNSIILFNYMIRCKQGDIERVWKEHFNEGIISSDRARKAAIEYGTFATPLSLLISKKSNLESLSVEDFVWAADALLFDQIMGENSIAYVDECIGTFVTSNRKTYSTQRKSYISYLEELAVELRILNRYRNGGNKEELRGNYIKAKMLNCIENNAVNFKDVLNIFVSAFRALIKIISGRNKGRNTL